MSLRQEMGKGLKSIRLDGDSPLIGTDHAWRMHALMPQVLASLVDNIARKLILRRFDSSQQKALKLVSSITHHNPKVTQALPQV